MGFGLQFQRGVEKGIPQGLQIFLSNKKLEATAQREQEKKKEKMIAKDREVTAQANILGVDAIRNPDTQELEYDIPADIDFSGISQVDRLKFLPDVGSEFQRIFTQLEKEAEPKDTFVNKRSEMDRETGKGIVTGIDKDPESPTFGDRIKIGNDPNYKFKTTDETFFEGEIEFEGQKIGIKGKRSKLIQYENGKFDIIQGISDIKGDGTDKPIETLKFESQVAKINVDKQKALERVENYQKKGVSERGRDFKRQRINADLNRAAWDYASLGSDEAQEYINELFVEGQNTINKGFVGLPDSRKDYYQRKEAEILAQNERGEWGHSDLTAILQFLQAKYRDYVVSEDAVQDDDELKFDLPELQLK